MFLDLPEFARAVLTHHPAVALITWESRSSLLSFLKRLGPELRKVDSEITLSRMASSEFDRDGFNREILSRAQRNDSPRKCLVVYGFEPLVTAAGETLNGAREQLANFCAVVLVIRENRRTDLAVSAPDLMDWVGPMCARVEDLSVPLRRSDVTRAIRGFEEQYKISSREFLDRWNDDTTADIPDAWFWRELIALRDDMK